MRVRFVFLRFPRVFGCVFWLCRMEELPPSPHPLLPCLCPYLSRPLPLPALPSLYLLTPNPFERSASLLNYPFQFSESLLPNPSLGRGVGIWSFLPEYNGLKLKYNDLVAVIMGTGHGVVGKKCEPIKARFKGVVDTSAFGGVYSWPLSSISATQCLYTECIWSVCAWVAGDALLLKLKAGNARPVRVLLYPPTPT